MRNLVGENYLFKLGVKPALLVKHKKRTREKPDAIEVTTKLFDEYKEMFPYILITLRNSAIFFQSQKDRDRFMRESLVYYQMEGKVNVTDFKHKDLGDALGFPPLATEKFRKLDKSNRVAVNYYGIRFVCHVEDVEECVNWMMENRKVPDSISEQYSIGIKVWDRWHAYQKNEGI